jgi:hypothetical protein
MKDKDDSWMRVADSALENDETPTDLQVGDPGQDEQQKVR